mmetsp:Transcript_111966/g.281806  ORF Transcript_111966/g.281806 Transcript_111966/m.281806 type:complete len:220 (-) Transcript_111966:2034-2693(-)
MHHRGHGPSVSLIRNKSWSQGAPLQRKGPSGSSSRLARRIQMETFGRCRRSRRVARSQCLHGARLPKTSQTTRTLQLRDLCQSRTYSLALRQTPPQMQLQAMTFVYPMRSCTVVQTWCTSVCSRRQVLVRPSGPSSTCHVVRRLPLPSWECFRLAFKSYRWTCIGQVTALCQWQRTRRQPSFWWSLPMLRLGTPLVSKCRSSSSMGRSSIVGSRTPPPS